MLADTADTLSGWLRETLLPGWLARVYDPTRPGFVEMLEPGGAASGSDIRSTLVTARLTYVFSHAHLLGVPGALDAARHGMTFLWETCRRPDGRFCYRCRASGEVVDTRSDFYDLAFVLFSLGWFARASGDGLALARAEEVMGFIETQLAHPDGGFREDTLGTLPRRQNPHMHLLEACHALAEASGDRRWLARADTIVALMRRRMLDEATDSLGEFFGEDWSAWPEPRGLVREPGHHYEWTWLLYHHERLTHSASARIDARRLYGFAERHRDQGKTHPVINEIDPNGAVLNGAALLWPQTEYLKALVARIEFEGDEIATTRLDGHLRLMFDRFVDRKTGLWINQIDSAGQAIIEPVPVRVLYHLLLACAEIVRLRPETRLP
ncbi:AGE family epimerase/isomerase [Bosea sp. LjRoot9]|uniref:AGE family epimerase/isomerase n=1 Tax=Bosea sp. LjRoot9 TaxID=3342341 RepID=UPI003ECF3A5E